MQPNQLLLSSCWPPLAVLRAHSAALMIAVKSNVCTRYQIRAFICEDYGSIKHAISTVKQQIHLIQGIFHLDSVKIADNEFTFENKISDLLAAHEAAAVTIS